jgi:hypothetical protein
MPHHMENSGIYVKMAYHKMRPTPSAFNQLVKEIICNDMDHTMSHNSNTVLHYLGSASSYNSGQLFIWS